MQATLSNDLDKIGPGEAQYTLLTNERGGIIDDLIVYRLDEFRYLLIVNAANREADLGWLKEREIRGSDVRDVSDEYALLAVQGPRAIERLGLPEARQFTFAEGRDRRHRVHGEPHRLHRRGTAASSLVMAEDAGDLWDSVLERGAVPCGLGARDTLRLEASLPLHGNDITPDTDAISAGLGWCCDARQGVLGRRGAARAQGARARAKARLVRDGGEGGPAAGHGDRGRRRGHLRNALADARPRHRDGLRPASAPRAPDTELAIDVRGKSRRGTRRQETDLQARGVAPVGRERDAIPTT